MYSVAVAVALVLFGKAESHEDGMVKPTDELPADILSTSMLVPTPTDSTSLYVCASFIFVQDAVPLLPITVSETELSVAAACFQIAYRTVLAFVVNVPPG